MNQRHEDGKQVEKPLFFGEFGEAITFGSRAECIPHAPQLAWRPASIAYRDSRDLEERQFITLYLRWLFSCPPDGIIFPMIIRRAGGRDQPDFLVAEGALEYGVEVTRATTWLLQRVGDARKKADSSASNELGSHLGLQSGPELNRHFDKASFSAELFLRGPGDDLVGDGFVGSDPEIAWADTAAYRISQKLEKLRDHYQNTVSTCDLVLYSDIAVFKLEVAIELLRERIVSMLALRHVPMVFRRVSVISDGYATFDVLRETCKIVVKDGSSCRA